MQAAEERDAAEEARNEQQALVSQATALYKTIPETLQQVFSLSITKIPHSLYISASNSTTLSGHATACVCISSVALPMHDRSTDVRRFAG